MSCHTRIESDLSFDAFLLPVLARPFGFVLESRGSQGNRSRWCYAGISPYVVLRGDVDSATVRVPGSQESLRHGEGIACLQELLEDLPSDGNGGPVPFGGGGIGFFGYGAGSAFEDLPQEALRDVTLPQVYWAFYDEVLAYDRREDQFWRVRSDVPDFVPESGNTSSSVQELLDEASSIPSLDGTSMQVEGGDVTANMDQNVFEAMVREAKSYIEAGDIYQVNLSRRLSMAGVGNPGAVYLRLRATSPAPYSGYIGNPDFAILSSSPELFLRRRGRRISTRPIKGTRPRSGNREGDEQQREELLNSEKDLAELHMIVDLERNDLGRICTYGTVRTDDLHTLESFANVHHLVGTVSGRLRPDIQVSDILRATFPGGSITGAPKIRAMEIIDELEPTQRQVYTGSMGWIAGNGDLELNICIRTLEWTDNTLHLQVGGGIVADSEPEEEYRETEDKARGMLSAMGLS